MTESDPRLEALRTWIASTATGSRLDPASLRPASSDASFRRYFRIDAHGPDQPSLVAMDAPPPREDCRPFVHAAERMHAAGVATPTVLESDLERGFLLLTDFGSRTMLAEITEHPEAADRLYRAANTELVTLQRGTALEAFAPYDRSRLLDELRLFDTWYLPRHKGIEPDDAMRKVLDDAYEALLENALAQPRVVVHRDWHSRNLMFRADGSLGVLDFQDALAGPITYDLVSILRDAYVHWPEAQQLDWAIRYWEAARAAGLPVAADFGDFYRDFEFMGLQRHLKVLGIFARLNYRDGKPAYLDDMPRVLAYVLHTARRYREFGRLAALVSRLEGIESSVGYTF